MSFYNSYEFYFGPRKGKHHAATIFRSDPYYQTAKEEKAEMERLEALQDEAREEYMTVSISASVMRVVK